MLGSVALMSLCLGVSSFACGITPLSFAFSKSYLDRLSALGTGLLLGAALGVIIPEGIEAIARSNPSSSLPTSAIALSLLFGFTLMLVIEQVILPHSRVRHDDLALDNVKGSTTTTIEFDADAELGNLEHDGGPHTGYQILTPAPHDVADAAGTAFPLTFGLVVHGLADGLALGVSSLSTDTSGGDSRLPIVVFLALLIHKAPTSFALTTSLLATSIPRAKCKKHLAVFSASTPAGAIASYMIFSFLGNGDSGWTGVALLVSGGTFLYVATVLQPVSHHSDVPAAGEIRPLTRVLFISLGIFAPFLMNAVLGHSH